MCFECQRQIMGDRELTSLFQAKQSKLNRRANSNTLSETPVCTEHITHRLHRGHIGEITEGARSVSTARFALYCLRKDMTIVTSQRDSYGRVFSSQREDIIQGSSLAQKRKGGFPFPSQTLEKGNASHLQRL